MTVPVLAQIAVTPKAKERRVPGQEAEVDRYTEAIQKAAAAAAAQAEAKEKTTLVLAPTVNSDQSKERHRRRNKDKVLLIATTMIAPKTTMILTFIRKIAMQSLRL